MAETDAAAAQQPPQIQMRVLGQFIRDMSFENVMAQRGASGDVQPDVNVQVNLDAKKRSTDNQYEIAIKLNITSKAKGMDDVLFVFEIDYCGIFHVEGVPNEQLHPFLLIECPRMLFPFLRRIVSDITRDGGYPPLNLDNIDFMALYRSELARQQAAAQAEQKADA
ncbi:protein-export chaperone SecB [Ruegeria pomeroyi]|jgi:preprotein translocase subunit SecB|uniref:Protein-export protein SecB n=2 Tax=Ruegeria pomeroyi TaxID=89184 RepID=SECB_RUEPO|nr:protein-export chaperone SecB [Ruegeria pomeroyi]Q5LLN4.1 RecName: Full=Protein-export protein SecB [Ruegeria pomeroyi DSS-3]HCE71054.1 protein-export chaperone SecB [Ruegeria sp.]AAV97102.1 protein-export protein SecB [Ruegeria pomeroyi DSS-3]NVK96044.1 protein-export chaperone SecB [Ruegeria pomeroyi]NVK99914.1 protein-export chaperone SecB [Ruegeria pomeroyi]QWV10625.1 protein-export chaperone SecB [Ruegeria pomeroyi]